MKRRNKVRILGQWITIQHVDLSKEEIHGDADTHKKIIRLDSSLNDTEYKRVLRHESYHIKLGLSGMSEQLDEKVEEALCVLAEID